MATITLEYDARNATLKKALDFVVSIGAKVVPQPKTKKCGLDEALEDIKAGRVYSAKSVDDMMKQILA